MFSGAAIQTMIEALMLRPIAAATCVALLSGLSLGVPWHPEVFAQGPPVVLQITSPSDGTVVNPGQTVTVVVMPNPGRTFTGVVLLSDPGLWLPDQLLTSSPYQFTFTIPAKAAIGVHFLTASGGRTGQTPGKSLPLHLHVEPSLAISSIKVEPDVITFRSAGDRIPLRVAGTFADGSVLDITKSTGTTYSSGDTTAVTVDSTGIVTAVGPGKLGLTPVLVHHGNQTFSVQVSTKRLPPPPAQ